MTLSTDLQLREDLIKLLNARVADADASLETLTTDLNYFRAQFHEARDRVIAGEKQTAELEALLGTLRGQLSLGLKQRDIHYDAVRKHRADELESYRVRNKLLLDQARLTDDGIRYKAAQYEFLKRENNQLREKVYQDSHRITKFRKRTGDLRNLLQTMRAREIETFDDAENASTDAEEFTSALSGEEYYTQYEVDTPSADSLDDLYSSSPVPPELSLSSGHPVVAKGGSEGADLKSQDSVVEGGSGARCKWREEEVQCTVFLETFQVCSVSSQFDFLWLSCRISRNTFRIMLLVASIGPGSERRAEDAVYIIIDTVRVVYVMFTAGPQQSWVSDGIPKDFFGPDYAQCLSFSKSVRFERYSSCPRPLQSLFQILE